MRRFPLRVSLLLAAIALTTCKDESTAPGGGVSSTVTATAFVDADGSIDRGAGDLAVSGQLVQLTPAAGGTALEATTDANGDAVFADVPPGGYVAAFAGSVPAGATLASAAEVGVTAPFEGAQLAVEYRFVYFPGALSGIVFRDENANGSYDAGTDTPGSGMTISLFAGSAVTTDTQAVAITAPDGTYGFNRLRPGPYTISIRSPAPTIQIAGDTIRTFQVPPAGTAADTVVFTGSLVVTIRLAKLASGSIVAIEGVVTAPQGAYRPAKDNLYMQDTSGGVQVFDLDSTVNIFQLGDSIRVIGRMGAFGGELEIVRIDATTRPTAVKLGTGTVPAARFLTGAEIFARTYEGELAFTANARLRFAPTGTTGGYNLRFEAAAGDTFTVRIESPLATPVPRSFWRAGGGYNLTGALGSFNAGAQLKPRSASDIQSAAPIRAAKLDSNKVVLIEGVVTAAQGTYRTDNAYLQDTSSGIQLFNLPTTLGLVVGDSLRIAGIMGIFSGEQEIVRFSTTQPPVVFRLGTGTVPAPRVVTGAELKARTFEGQLVTAVDDSLRLLPTGTTGAYTLRFHDPAGAVTDTFQVRIEAPVATPVPRSFWQLRRYDITGVLGAFGNAPNTSAQLKPRGSADIVPK